MKPLQRWLHLLNKKRTTIKNYTKQPFYAFLFFTLCLSNRRLYLGSLPPFSNIRNSNSVQKKMVPKSWCWKNYFAVRKHFNLMLSVFIRPISYFKNLFTKLYNVGQNSSQKVGFCVIILRNCWNVVLDSTYVKLEPPRVKNKYLHGSLMYAVLLSKEPISTDCSMRGNFHRMVLVGRTFQPLAYLCGKINFAAKFLK